MGVCAKVEKWSSEIFTSFVLQGRASHQIEAYIEGISRFVALSCMVFMDNSFRL